VAKLNVPDYWPGKLTIDGVDIVLHVRRHDMDESLAFEREYFKYASPDRGVLDAVEGEDNMTVEDIMVAREQAKQRRELQMTQYERDVERERIIKKAEEMTEWIKRSVTENISLPEGELEWRGSPVLSGATLLKLFGGRSFLMMQICNLIWATNHLPEQIKNVLPSLSDFPASSVARLKAAPGKKQEPTVGSVGSGDSAPVEDVTMAPKVEDSSSGETTL